MRFLPNLLASLLVLLLAGCSGGPVKKPTAEVIRPEVQRKLDESREALSKNNIRLSLSLLAELGDDGLEPVEKAMKYNLKGVVHFTQADWDKSLANFEVARKYVPDNSTLEAQVWLNIASARFKQGLFAELKTALDEVSPDALPEPEVRKYAQLKLAWAVRYQRHYETVETSVLLLRNAKSLAEVQNSVLKERMTLAFKALEDHEKSKLLDQFGEKKWLPLAHLGMIEAEERYFRGDLSGAQDVLGWLGRFSSEATVKTFVADFEQRLDSSTRLSMDGIGVILPLTGEKGSFGQKALLGVDAGIKGKVAGREVRVHTKDDAGSAAMGAQAVRELVRDHSVPLIIGGLFPETARAEYLEAKRWGVLYISLAPVHLPREEKNYLLIEMQGSTESQVAALVSDEMLAKFGKRIGVVYPEGEAGKSYVDEFWRSTLTRGTSLTGVASYPKGTMDYRETIQHLLGLRFPREREEEAGLYRNAYELERSSIRRIQTLPPALDADWVFVASFPHEALSLVPTFGYYDAQQLPIFGGWAGCSVNQSISGHLSDNPRRC